ncbi:unnamed protein product [Cuscuta epithymum]|uniref:DUF4283 domain-containing protein n=1 Tax=Cuscuta epithymum TaxID=186058 RepID=A0AAV0F9N7_9ASTE|nr:unnamed protein product [Cuscuta epithymum]
MVRSKQGPGVAARITRSSRFSALEDADEEFPTLKAAKLVKVGETNPSGTAKTKASGYTTLDAMEATGSGTPNLKEQPAGAAKEPAFGTTGANKAQHVQPITTQTVVSGEIKSWNSLFRDNRDPKNGIKLKYVPPKGETLDFGDRVLPSMVEMWGYCLVGQFTGKFPGLKAVHDLKAKWGVKCLVRSHNKGWIIFKFQNEEDRSKVLLEGPYTVFGKLLMLKVLSEDFTFEDEEFLKIPIWTKFPKLPMSLWNDEAMSEVASMVGVPITTDKITQERANNDYARVLIEVDVSKPPPLHFPIRLPSRKVIKQNVLYETFPNFCFQCKEFGHHPFICKKLAKRDDGEREKEKCIEENEKIGKVAAKPQTAAAQGSNPTGLAPDPTGSLAQTATATVQELQTAPHPPGGLTDPTGPTSQGSANDKMGAALKKNPQTEGLSKDVDKDFEAGLVDTERIVMDEKDLKLNDVVFKCAVINDKTLKLAVKPFKFVHASVIIVDTSLRLTDDLDRKGLTFTAKCLKGMPGVTKKKVYAVRMKMGLLAV